MKAFKVKFLNGHFIDIETDKRINLVQSMNYTISADDDSFSIEDRILTKKIILSSEEKSKWVLEKYGKDNYGFIAQAGTFFRFDFTNNKIAKGDKGKSFKFTCEILEDLYLYKLEGRDFKKDESWRLAECKCELSECIEGDIAFTEKIISDSLNQLFSDTIMFYFPRQRSGACNAFAKYHLYEKKSSSSLLSSYSIKSVNNLRLEWVKKNAQNHFQEIFKNL